MSGGEALRTLRDRGIVAGSALSFALYVLAQRVRLRRYDAEIANIRTEDDTGVTLSFMREFVRMTKMALPTVWCKEFLGTAAFILLFVVKSILRVAQSSAYGRLMKSMIEGTGEQRIQNFTRALLLRCAVSLMTAVCSGSVEYLRPWLIACYRARLSKQFQRRFFSHLIYYQATVLDKRLEAADTVISTYCGEFAEHLAELPYYFLMPAFECSTSLVALTQHVGGRAAATACGAVAVSVYLLQRLAPAFGRIHASLLSKEDNYRRMLTNNLNNVESIAMHSGGSYTRQKLDTQVGRLQQALNHVALARAHFNLLEVAFSGLLQMISGLVVFGGSLRTGDKSLSDLYVEVQYMQDVNESVRDFVVNLRELSHLSTFTTKLAEFDTTLASIAQGTLIHSMVSTPNTEAPIASPISYTHTRFFTRPEAAQRFLLFGFSDLKLMTPSGQVLFSDLSLRMESDQDWVILGENGCGKTSLLRMISGLWPPTEGSYSMEQRVKLLFAPQHSYMVPQCTLLEQVLFPKLITTVGEKELSCFKQALQLAGAQSVIDVLGGFESAYVGTDPQNTDECYDWSSLSGGQKQRISMARVFYHVLTADRSKETPVAIMDEATSMMDETEQEVLLNLRRLDVRMLSVTHREDVIAHHTHMLRVLHGGKWTVAPVVSRVGLDGKVQNARVSA
ncbi:ABC transporter [Trypanosoma grayi]|uniref:ABC transporter n=1 Tax=Trypanosoma grayi TaxID=71804 RepID=UPI0004F490C3|nr:ABC transporter [Trypanosoma grayi]KEG15110.1 ABC transporter [Trypanosoma grayi]